MSGASFGFASQVGPWVWAATFKHHTYTHTLTHTRTKHTKQVLYHSLLDNEKNGRVSLPTDLGYRKRSFPSPPETWVWEGRISVRPSQVMTTRPRAIWWKRFVLHAYRAFKAFLRKRRPHQRFKGSDCGKTEGETSRGRVRPLSSHPWCRNCWTALCTLRLWQWCGRFMNFCGLTSRQ